MSGAITQPTPRAMPIQTALAIAVLGAQCKLTHASWGYIAGYASGSKVTSHNAIDLDQKALQNALGQPTIDYALVTNIYEKGGNSKTYAEFSVPPLTSALSKKDPVLGATSRVTGTMYSNYAIGATSIKVAYATSDTQATYVSCKGGALEDPPSGTSAAAMQPYTLSAGCFQNEALSIGPALTAVIVTPSGAPVNKAGRTLQGFSTKAEGAMYDLGTNGGCSGASDRATDGCPYFDFTMYYNYYGNFDYANMFVTAALKGEPTGFTRTAGNMDFTGAADSLRKECIQKGTAYMNAYMYAIREFEDAIDDCKAGCTNGIVGDDVSCNGLSTAAVHAWDEGVAFYSGSREGALDGGDSDGVLSYRVAEKRCKNFKTCGEKGDSTSGTSYVNTELFRLLAIGGHKLLLGQCEAVRPVLRKMVAVMSIPLIQGTLRYAYKVDLLGGGDKEKGEGAVFAAAIVPRVAYCDPADAKIIMDNLKVGASSTAFAAVKTAFENNYACMNVTCEEVGGLWLSAESKYYDGATPCGLRTPSEPRVIEKITVEEEMPMWALSVIIAVSTCVVCLLAGCGLLILREKRTGKPAFCTLKDKETTTATTIGSEA